MALMGGSSDEEGDESIATIAPPRKQEKALKSQKAKLLDSGEEEKAAMMLTSSRLSNSFCAHPCVLAAPLCGVVLSANGKAKVCNKLFVELMGPLFKFENYEFSEAATNDAGKAKLKAAIEKVRSGASPRERLRNLEMLTLAGEAGLPVKSHFDWFIGPNTDVTGEGGEVTLFGDPCSDDILEQREKDAELIDFFQNAPIALHWLSGTGHVLWANQTELGE